MQIPTIPAKPNNDFRYENANMQGIAGLSDAEKPDPQHFTPAGLSEKSPLEPNDNIEAIIGMPLSEALDIYTANGKPLIHLSDGVDCRNLEMFFSSLDMRKPEQIEEVKKWLKPHRLPKK